MAATHQVITVLVTGATGFVAGHCIAALLDQGYSVRGTVRDLSNDDKNKHLRDLENLGAGLELVEANLDDDLGWSEAVADCRYVLHVASPFPSAIPEDENDLIRPAVDGTRRVLEACAATKGAVKRVVLTSSIAAISVGHGNSPDYVYSEQDWSVLENCDPYPKSKTLAERAAWTFVEALEDESRFELSVINPGFVCGPLMSDAGGTSSEVVCRLLGREMPACPNLGWAMVDVRDIAQAQLLAMTRPEAAGHRYVCAGKHLWLRDMAKILDEEFRPLGFRVPTGHLPYAIVWLVARFDQTLRSVLPSIGRQELVSAEKAKRELGWKQRTYRETLVDMGHSAIRLGLVSA